MALYDNVKSAADKKGISIARLEQEAEIANGTIGKWRDNGKPFAETLQKVANVLEVSMESLISEE